MPVGYQNLSGYVKGLINGPYPDIGQVYFVVDSDFRTEAQGWQRADGTGPLDLWRERNPGYVFHGSGSGGGIPYAYSRDQLAVQAAIDATIDNRGDIVFFTPGAYSIGTTSLAFNSRGVRYLGPPVRNPKRALVTITDAIGDNAVSVDDNEFGFITFVPLTAQNWFSIANDADNGYIHDCYFNSDGIAASTSTEFIRTAATSEEWLIERVDHLVDAAQGDAYTLVGSNWWTWQDCNFILDGGTWATVFTFVTTASQGALVQRSNFYGAGGSSTFTNIFTGMAGANMLRAWDITIDGSAMATGTDIETGFDATTGIDIARCWLTGDATLQGGTEIVLA